MRGRWGGGGGRGEVKGNPLLEDLEVHSQDVLVHFFLENGGHVRHRDTADLSHCLLLFFKL